MLEPTLELHLYEAAGNRFAIFDGRLSGPPTNPAALARELCLPNVLLPDWRADGLLVLVRGADQTDGRMLIFNADGTRAEAEVFRRNPVRLPIPQLPTPPIEPVRVAWSGGGGSGRQSLMESSLRKILDDTPELA